MAGPSDQAAAHAAGIGVPITAAFLAPFLRVSELKLVPFPP